MTAYPSSQARRRRFGVTHILVAVAALAIAAAGAALALGSNDEGGRGGDGDRDRATEPSAQTPPGVAAGGDDASDTVTDTGAAAATGFRVVAVGDIACKPGLEVTPKQCQHAAVADRVQKLAPRRLLLLGDIQYDMATEAEFTGSYDKTWGRFNSIAEPVPGNHEYFTNKAAGYYGYFGAKAHGPNGYYSFDAGGWHFVALNANCSFVACAKGSKQERWLRRDLAQTRRRCVAGYWHQPRFSSGEHGNDSSTRDLWETLDRAGASMVLSGHDHDYERFAPQTADAIASRSGIRGFVVGTGGRHFYPLSTRRANSVKFIADEFGVLDLRLRRASYSWRFVTEDGKVLDRGSARCIARPAR